MKIASAKDLTVYKKPYALAMRIFRGRSDLDTHCTWGGSESDQKATGSLIRESIVHLSQVCLEKTTDPAAPANDI